MIEFTKEQKQYLKDKLHHLNNAVVDRVIEYLPEINSKTSHNSSFIQDFKMKMRDILLSNLSAEEKLQELNKLRQS